MNRYTALRRTALVTGPCLPRRTDVAPTGPVRAPHRKSPSRVGEHRARKTVGARSGGLCEICGAHPAYALGWCVKRDNNPADIPVQLWMGRFLLDNHGDYTATDLDEAS